MSIPSLAGKISNVVTCARVDPVDLYRLMGCPPEQAALMEKWSFLIGNTTVWWSAGLMLPLIGYLIWVKRFFRRAA